MLEISLTVIKLSLIAAFGFVLYRRNIVDDRVLRFLTLFIINFSLPCLFFSQLVSDFQTVLAYSLWSFLGLSLAIFLVGLILGLLFSIGRKKDLKREFLSVISLQNSGYLPMNIAYFFFSENLRSQFLVYVFLYLLGYNILMWSVGSFFIYKRKGEGFSLKSLFNPPVIGILLSLFFVYTKTAEFIPAVILDPVKMVGQTSFVLSMLVLGCWLARVKLKDTYKRWFILLEASVLKLLVLPLLAFFALLRLELFSLFGLFILLEAAMPSAASLPIVADMRGGDGGFASQSVFVTHFFSMITIPFWLWLYLRFTPFVL